MINYLFFVILLCITPIRLKSEYSNSIVSLQYNGYESLVLKSSIVHPTIKRSGTSTISGTNTSTVLTLRKTTKDSNHLSVSQYVKPSIDDSIEYFPWKIVSTMTKSAEVSKRNLTASMPLR